MASNFLFTCCQSGMENHLKQEFLTHFPGCRFSFSQRGFVVFKIENGSPFPGLEKLVTARTLGHSLFDIRLDSIGVMPEAIRWTAKSLQMILDRATQPEADILGETAVRAIVEQLKERTENQIPYEHVHFWLRDGLEPAGEFVRSVGVSQRHERILRFQEQLEAQLKLAGCVQAEAKINENAATGSRVLDICLLNPLHFWIGQHVVHSPQQRWPGGVLPVVPTAVPPISRAYFKIREAVIWSGLSGDRKTRVVDIGASPGGSCQWLLEQGMSVIGIDPADMDPTVTSHPRFTHIRKRGREVRRKEISGIDWLLSDANISPNQIMDTFEELLQHPSVQPSHLILTIKLPDIKALENLETWQARINSWGFPKIHCRQLVFNRQEICLVASRH